MTGREPHLAMFGSLPYAVARDVFEELVYVLEDRSDVYAQPTFLSERLKGNLPILRLCIQARGQRMSLFAQRSLQSANCGSRLNPNPSPPSTVSGNGLEPMLGGKGEQLGGWPALMLLAALPLADHASGHIQVCSKHRLADGCFGANAADRRRRQFQHWSQTRLGRPVAATRST